ncbi:MAG: PAS domain-containing protein [Nitratireductor sp.]|nr:PAS domain-containing protein [Nitratireductor sp.]
MNLIGFSTLYTLTDRLYRAQTSGEVFEAALEAITQSLGARASILLFDDCDVMRFVAWRGLSDGYRAAVDGHTPWKAGELDPDPIYVSDILETGEPQWLKDRIVGENIRALAFIPLVAKGRTIGKFMTYYPEPHDFTPQERDLALTIARQVGFSLERAYAERDRQTTEDELRLSEERFRMMAEDAPVMIWISDAHGRCLHLNRMLRTFWNVTQEDMEDFDWRTTMHPEDATTISEAMIDAIQGQKSVSVKGRYLWSRGGYRILQTDAQPVFNAKGEFNGMIGVNVDVTDRETSEMALRESEQRFRDLAEAVPQLVWTSDALGNVDYWNSRIEAYALDHRAGAGIYRWEGLLHEEDLPATAAAWRMAVSNCEGFQFSHRLKMADGSYRWHLSRANPVFDSLGSISRWYGTATDIHDLRMAEERLRESEQRQRIAVYAAGLGVFEWNLDEDKTLWGNDRMYEIFGHSHVDGTVSYSEFMKNYLHPDDMERVENAMRDARQPNSLFQVSCRIFRRSDSRIRWLDAAGRFTFSADGRPARLIGVVADVTERRATEEHRKLLVNELNHRVKNTLSVVQALAQQTFKTEKRDDPRVEVFDGRLSALAHAHNLLSNENWETADLAEVARRSLLSRGPEKARIRLDGPVVILKPKQAVTMAMALHELYTNAVKYGALANDSGRIELLWNVKGNGSRQLDLVWRESDGPPVAKPTRHGFGSRMITQALKSELGATVDMDFRSEGLVCHIEAPLSEYGGRS